MNPAILNYWQSQQQIGDQMQLLNNNAQSADNAQMSVGANPFDAGIQRAISAARDSLGMTEKQQDRALRRSLLNFASNIAQTPKRKGFFNNFGDISRAALPAISEYDNAEAEAEMANNALANQILNHQKGLRGEAFEREKFNSQAKFQQDQLAETKRYHDLINTNNQAKLTTAGSTGKGAHGKSDAEKTMALAKLLDNAEMFLNSPEGQKSQIGRLQSMSPLSLPNSSQASLKQYEDSIKGALFNKLGYKNEAEFKHTPSISSNYDPATNLKIIENLRKSYIDMVEVIAPSGKKGMIPRSAVAASKYTIVE
jgi:hypothetical protein